MLHQILQQPHCAGIVVAVSNPFIHGHADFHRVPHLISAIILENRPHLRFTDGDKQGIGAPVAKVMVSGLKFNGAEVGKENGSIWAGRMRYGRLL